MREDAGRIVVDDLEIGDQRGSGVESFEKVMRQERVLGHATIKCLFKRVDVVRTLAGVGPFVEQILIDVRHSRRVRIDPGMSGVCSGE